MTYDETIQYLYNSIPNYQLEGDSAYKPGLDNSLKLDKLLKEPHRTFRSIHVAGTNGKGSVSHMLASVLYHQGYKVGLFTSPHLIDFRERIRVDGEMIPKDYVTDFIEKYKASIEEIKPSFFELTSTLAFDYFRHSKVDIAVIETGLGGRLDSTNIIEPILSIITNIGLDHTQYLGNTLELIAAEKAGIFKPKVASLVGQVNDDLVKQTLIDKAKEVDAPLSFAEDFYELRSLFRSKSNKWKVSTATFGSFSTDIRGDAQKYNIRTAIAAVLILRKLNIEIMPKLVKNGFSNVVATTGLMGRWHKLQGKPYIVCDTAHNADGWKIVGKHLEELKQKHKRHYMIVGLTADKDVEAILALMPKDAVYYFTNANNKRALNATILENLARKHELYGEVFSNVKDAVMAVLETAKSVDFVFVGGSTFVVGETLQYFNEINEQEK